MSLNNGNKISWRSIFRRKQADAAPEHAEPTDVDRWIEEGAVPVDELPIAVALMVERLADQLAPRIAADLFHRLRPDRTSIDVVEHLRQAIAATEPRR